jgi:hypothetical protein
MLYGEEAEHRRATTQDQRRRMEGDGRRRKCAVCVRGEKAGPSDGIRMMWHALKFWEMIIGNCCGKK